MACYYIEPTPEMVALFAHLQANHEARSRCKVHWTKIGPDTYEARQGNARVGFITHGTIVRSEGRWFVRTEPELDDRINGPEGFSRRAEAKRALLWFWRDGTTNVNGTIVRDSSYAHQ